MATPVASLLGGTVFRNEVTRAAAGARPQYVAQLEIEKGTHALTF
jgi:hypothetical protein